MKRYIIVVLALVMDAVCHIALGDTNNLSAHKNILIISSYNPETMSVAGTIDDFITHFHDKGDSEAVVMIENMNCKSLSEAHTWADRIRNIINRYSESKNKPDLVVLIGQEAWASYLSLSPSEMNGNLPVMCSMVSRNIVRMPSDTCRLDTWMPTSIDYTFLRSRYNIVGGVVYEYDIEKNIDLIRQMYPDTENIALLTDNSYGGLTMLAHVKNCIDKHKEYNFIKLDGRKHTIYSMSELINQLPDKTVMLIGTWRVDETESYYVKNSTHLLKDANNKLPVLTLSSIGLGFWALGGYMPNYHSQGVEVAEMAIDYFSDRGGKKEANVNDKITVVGGNYVFDAQRLNEYGIDVAELPQGGRFVNIKPTFYQQNKLQIYIAIVVFIIMVAILTIVSVFLARVRNLNKRLKKYQGALIAARNTAEDRSNMKTAFLANMSHEIRTPLNAIIGFSELLATDESLTRDERIEITKVMKKNSTMILNLVNDILHMARLESGKVKYEVGDCDLVDLCKDTLYTCKTAMKSELEYKFITDMDECLCSLDKQHIRQVLINLLSNANKFTKEGSITLSLRKDDHTLVISVTDTGSGVPKEKRTEIFERYEKLNEEDQGFGIGLSLCKSIVEHFDGTIWVDPEYTDGARFVFTLPYILPIHMTEDY